MGIYDRDYYQADEMRPLRPWDGKSMVTLLIIANVIVFIANFLFSQRNSLAEMLTLSASDLQQPLHWFRLLSYGFVHAPNDPFHLVFNMVTLYFLGRNVEDKYGKWEFFRFYMLTLLLCGIGWCLVHYNQPSARLLGASGATTAVAMLFVFSFPHATLSLYGVLPIKAWMLGLMIILMNVFGSRQHVAYEVHLIGAGLAAIYFYLNLNLGFLGDALSGASLRMRQWRRGLRVHRPAGRGFEGDNDSGGESPLSKDEAEADRILDKIHREGKDSLTAREQAFMEKYSRKVREQRR